MSKRISRQRTPRRRLQKHKPRKHQGRVARFGVFRSIARLLVFVLFAGAVLVTLALTVFTLEQDKIVRTKFEGKRWALPARVYARPMELFVGMEMNAEQFASELSALPYRQSDKPGRPGTYRRQGDSFDIYTRTFDFWDGREPARLIRLQFDNNALHKISSLDDQAKPTLMRIEPIEIAGIYPAHGEDRILVRRKDMPKVLVDALLAVEDRSFYEHFGVDPRGIARAMVANFRAGRLVQGASTLTQQLVKNFFLTSERTLQRKLHEMLLSVLLEFHYDKDQILEAYANEIYLGQDGSRAIHGFGLASRFFFDRTLNELDLHHMALLVGIIKGPARYNPRRKPERAKARRATVLDIMVTQGMISAADATTAKQKPLDVTAIVPRAKSPYPAFLDLVRRQLRENYREEDLTSEGLKVFTTLDPQVQHQAEQALISILPDLEKRARSKRRGRNIKPGDLQAASIIADTQTGEVRAVVGGRDVRLAGFNRALDAKRPAGSLIKPAIYLTALELPIDYTLATLLDDETPLIQKSGGKRWQPNNYDKKSHGWVTLQEALVRSYNIPTARLGLELDLLRVINTLHRLGLKRELKPYPALLLGAIDLSPFEVAQFYATFASGGYRLPLRTIREVTAASGKPLPRLYELKLEQAVKPGPAYLITTAMQQVVTSGTARRTYKTLPKYLNIAGKTGTTDDYRDSWFAGFSGNLLGVAWIGRDNNKPTGLSGSDGALPLWIETMKRLPLTTLDPHQPPEIEHLLIDPSTGYRAYSDCKKAQLIPFIAGSAPRNYSSCGAQKYTQHGKYDNNDNQTSNNADKADSVRSFFQRLVE